MNDSFNDAIRRAAGVPTPDRPQERTPQELARDALAAAQRAVEKAEAEEREAFNAEIRRQAGG